MNAVVSAAAWAGVGLFAWAAWQCLQTAEQAAELWPYLISETENFAPMYTLEDQQFKWRLVGGLCAVCSLLFLAAGLWLSRGRREGKPK